MAVIQGLSVLAREGASREKLIHIENMAMLVWPRPENDDVVIQGD